jgi:hypothetical protein
MTANAMPISPESRNFREKRARGEAPIICAIISYSAQAACKIIFRILQIQILQPPWAETVDAENMTCSYARSKRTKEIRSAYQALHFRFAPCFICVFLLMTIIRNDVEIRVLTPSKSDRPCSYTARCHPPAS